MAGRRLCSVCCTQAAPYTCPRCHKAYCTSACYKQHSEGCTEAFYREQATQQLKATRADPQQAQHMVAILQRLHEQEQQERGAGSDGSDSSSGSSESDGDSDGDEDGGSGGRPCPPHPHRPSRALRRLVRRAAAEGDAFDVAACDVTPELVAELEALNLRGQLSHLVTPWQPWWDAAAAADLRLGADGQAVVQELPTAPSPPTTTQQQQQQRRRRRQQQQQQRPVRVCLSSGVPAGPDGPLPTLAQLAGSRHAPSPLLPWQLLQLLVGYCLLLRRFNGEPEAGGGWEAAEQLLHLAPPMAHAGQAGQQQRAGGDGGGEGSCKGTSAEGAAAGAREREEPRRRQGQEAGPMGQPDTARAALLQLMDAALPHLAPELAAQRGPLLQAGAADALRLLQLGRPAVVLALLDSQRLLLQGRAHARRQRQRGAAGRQQQEQHQPQQDPLQHMKLAARKAWYFVVWANEQHDVIYQALAGELEGVLVEQAAMAQPQQPGVTLTPGAAAQPARRRGLPQGAAAAAGAAVVQVLGESAGGGGAGGGGSSSRLDGERRGAGGAAITAAGGGAPAAAPASPPAPSQPQPSQPVKSLYDLD